MLILEIYVIELWMEGIDPSCIYDGLRSTWNGSNQMDQTNLDGSISRFANKYRLNEINLMLVIFFMNTVRIKQDGLGNETKVTMSTRYSTRISTISHPNRPVP